MREEEAERKVDEDADRTAHGWCTLAGPASAATFTVSDLDDLHDTDFGFAHDGTCDAAGADTCTLRAAVEEANAMIGSDTINVSETGTINLSLMVNGELNIDDATTINGNAAGTTIAAGAAGRAIVIGNSPSVTLSDLRIQSGAATSNGAGIASAATLLTLNRVTVAGNTVSSAGGFGGAGIATVGSADSLVLNDSTVSGNTITGTDGRGGGIRARGPLTLNRSTVSGNLTTFDAGAGGGGIFAGASSPNTPLNIINSTISDNNSGAGGGGGLSASSDYNVTIIGSTIAGNSTTGTGGAVLVSGALFTSENTIYALNTATVSNDNCTSFAAATAAENNIDTGTSCNFGNVNGNQENVSTDALGLGALASNGGPSQTRAIASGSVAQNAASGDCGGLAVDQLGTARPQGASCDIGAFELGVAAPPPPPPTGGGGSTTTPSVPATPAATKKCKKGQKLKKGRCVKKKAKKK